MVVDHSAELEDRQWKIGGLRVLTVYPRKEKHVDDTGPPIRKSGRPGRKMSGRGLGSSNGGFGEKRVCRQPLPALTGRPGR